MHSSEHLLINSKKVYLSTQQQNPYKTFNKINIYETTVVQTILISKMEDVCKVLLN